MAEVDFDQFESGADPRTAGMSRLINIAGATCSVALVVGLGVWGYQLAVRDVNGVPVVRAMAGPMREAPLTPGGDVASHQGLSVNAVAAVGIAAPLSEQLLLAPAPVDLAAEDAPGLAVDAVDVGTSSINPVALSGEDALAGVVLGASPAEQPADLGTDAAVALALADALAAGAEPFTELAADPADLVLAAAPTAIQRPRPRPTEAVPTAPTMPEPAAAVVAPTEIDPATLTVGTRLVQLGAFDTGEDARAEWTRLQTQLGALLDGKSVVVQAAESGGRTFYRLRAYGFADENGARQFCAALVAQNAPCIPALHR